MNPPTESPCAENEPQWRRFAACYLKEAFPERPPAELSKPALFDSSPLDGEGAVLIYEFTANPGDQGETAYFVAVGKTVPNYYPMHNLDPDDAFNLHLGTRFMLVMGVGQAEPSQRARFDAAASARDLIDRVAPGEPIEAPMVSAAFDVDGQLHVVLCCKVDGEPVYLFAGECPPGFSRRTDIPPHVAYRIHLGRILRGESEERTQ